MRIQTCAFVLLAVGVGSLLAFGGCSEDKPTAEGDTIVPQVSVTWPYEQEITGFRVQDSTTVVVHATDNDHVAQVQLWALFHDEEEPEAIGPALVEPDSAGFYSYFWDISGIENGKAGVLYAIATDVSGNSASSEKVRIQILNQSQSSPPTADFTITPPEGTVETLFRFDPSITRDAVEPNETIVVRWDFDYHDGDTRWDIDTSATSTATTVVSYQYTVPGTYRIRMQAFNHYYSIPHDRPGEVFRDLLVTAAEGKPNPPSGMKFIEIPAGTYPIGAVACADCGALDDDEVLAPVRVPVGHDTITVNPPVLVAYSNPFRISKREVSNRFYIVYLNRALAEGKIAIDLNTLEVSSTSTGDVFLVLDQRLTRVRYALATNSFYVDPAYEAHPVTGVSWYGATAWANYYGLRLPTEIEWEIAARGTMQPQGPFYPWDPSNVIDGNYANYRHSGDPYESGGVEGSTTPAGAYGDTMVVTSLNAVSPMGTYDQAGNVAEWIKDWYGEDFYTQTLMVEQFANRMRGQPVNNPASPLTGTVRCLRGGSFFHWPEELRVTNRMSALPDEKSPWIGFRVAYIPVAGSL